MLVSAKRYRLTSLQMALCTGQYPELEGSGGCVLKEGDLPNPKTPWKKANRPKPIGWVVARRLRTERTGAPPMTGSVDRSTVLIVKTQCMSWTGDQLLCFFLGGRRPWRPFPLPKTMFRLSHMLSITPSLYLQFHTKQPSCTEPENGLTRVNSSSLFGTMTSMGLAVLTSEGRLIDGRHGTCDGSSSEM